MDARDAQIARIILLLDEDDDEDDSIHPDVRTESLHSAYLNRFYAVRDHHSLLYIVWEAASHVSVSGL